jgi:hypothetical protein
MDREVRTRWTDLVAAVIDRLAEAHREDLRSQVATVRLDAKARSMRTEAGKDTWSEEIPATGWPATGCGGDHPDLRVAAAVPLVKIELRSEATGDGEELVTRAEDLADRAVLALDRLALFGLDGAGVPSIVDLRTPEVLTSTLVQPDPAAFCLLVPSKIASWGDALVAEHHLGATILSDALNGSRVGVLVPVSAIELLVAQDWTLSASVGAGGSEATLWLTFIGRWRAPVGAARAVEVPDTRG